MALVVIVLMHFLFYLVALNEKGHRMNAVLRRYMKAQMQQQQSKDIRIAS
jgi:hypothetical protein